MILFWRLVSFALLMTGIFLLAQSLMSEKIELFYGALVCYGLASLIWITMQKWYVESFKPHLKRNKASSLDWLSDFVNILDLVFNFPKYMFYILLRFIHFID